MSRRLSGPIGVALLVAVSGTTAAFAEDAPAPSAAPAASDAPPAAAPAASPTPAGSASSAAPAPPSKAGLTGYGYGGSKAPPPSAADSSSYAPRRHLLVHHANEAVATFTGFEMLADGGSRLFVQLSKQVDVEPEKADAPPTKRAGKAKKGPGKLESQVVSRLKFVIKGAEIVNPINEGSLVMVHFNTPILRSRLVPAGKNLALMVELRADVTPEVKFVPAKDNGSMLQIDFPKGSYLPAGDAEPAPSAQAPGATDSSAFPATAPPPSAGANDSTGPK